MGNGQGLFDGLMCPASNMFWIWSRTSGSTCGRIWRWGNLIGVSSFKLIKCVTTLVWPISVSFNENTSFHFDNRVHNLSPSSLQGISIGFINTSWESLKTSLSKLESIWLANRTWCMLHTGMLADTYSYLLEWFCISTFMRQVETLGLSMFTKLGDTNKPPRKTFSGIASVIANKSQRGTTI